MDLHIIRRCQQLYETLWRKRYQLIRQNPVFGMIDDCFQDPEFTKTGYISLTGLVKTNQYPEKQAVQAESLHGLTEIILVFLPFVVKRKDEKHRKRRSAGRPAAGHDLSGEGRKTDPFSRAERTGTRLRCSRSR